MPRRTRRLPPRAVSRGVRAAPAAAAGSTARDWTAEERELFARHVVNLRKGRLSSDGSFSSSAEQVQRIFTEHIPPTSQRSRRSGRPARVMFFAHGGLVEEREGLLPVLARRRFWELNGVYPVYFVWETGLRETLSDIVGGAIVPTRGAAATLSDLAIEKLARTGGKPVWGQMKKSAEQARRRPAAARGWSRSWPAPVEETNGEIEFHALGHSAGAILQRLFLPLLVRRSRPGVPPVERALAAPAGAGDHHRSVQGSQLKPLVGPGKPITRLTTYTMTDELEQTDSSLKPYGKSLLYLVSGAFEDAVPTRILGMQKA